MRFRARDASQRTASDALEERREMRNKFFYRSFSPFRLKTLVAASVLVLSMSGISNAELFTDIVNFSGTDEYSGSDYLELSGTGSDFLFDYTHMVNFVPPAAAITSAEIKLTHHNNSNNNGEVWFLYGSTSELLGTLEDSTGTGWLTQSFVIPSNLYSAAKGGSWTLQLKLKENTSGTDKLWIDKSELTGEYTAAPLPAAAWLLGSGLVGLIGIRRRAVR